MKDLKELLNESLIAESIEDKIIKDAEKLFKNIIKKTVSIEDDINPLLHQNFDLQGDINHTEGLIYVTVKDHGKLYTLCLDSEDDWSPSKGNFNLKKIVCVPGDCEDDDVIDKMYKACGY